MGLLLLFVRGSEQRGSGEIGEDGEELEVEAAMNSEREGS